MRLLLLEDDPHLQSELKQSLGRAGFVVDCCGDGPEGEFMGATEPYDAIVLDLGLPGKSGLEILVDWRAQGINTPVLILTARGAWHEKVEGFNTGADDYLAKPFHFEELKARLEALIRRRYGRAAATLVAGDMELDIEQQRVKKINGESIELTATEFRLLQYLMHHPGKIISKSRLLEHAFDGSANSEENLVEVYIKRLRNKIGQERIITRRGQGYLLRDTL
ncbi:MAG TPA: response regulator transcription factor [Gammaproteobacteria bacterium]|nr:response regulator transcription factor [Gammaproteobacteria bacterium]